MSITSRVGVVKGYKQSLPFAKTGPATQTAGGFTSYWRTVAFGAGPGAGTLPTAAAICDETTTGALTYDLPISGTNTYIYSTALRTNTSGGQYHVMDRLAHMGGLSGTVTTAQTVGVDVSGSSSNLGARRGAADYSDVTWWLEWYTDTGATAVNASVAVTYDDSSTDTIVVALAATMRQARMLPILPNVAGRYIKSVQSVTLSASTLAAGDFGVTAARFITDMTCFILTPFQEKQDWTDCFARVVDRACLFFVAVSLGVTAGFPAGEVRISQG